MPLFSPDVSNISLINRLIAFQTSVRVPFTSINHRSAERFSIYFRNITYNSGNITAIRKAQSLGKTAGFRSVIIESNTQHSGQ